MGHETYKADLGCGLQTKKSAIFDLYSYTKSVPSVQSRERHSLPPAIKIDIWFHGYFFDNYFMNLMKSYVEYSLNIYVA